MGNNVLPLDVNVEEGRLNVTIFKMDSGTFLLQNNDKGQGDDRLQVACTSADDVEKKLSAIIDQFKSSMKSSIASMDKKWQGFDFFIQMDFSSDGVDEELEVTNEMSFNLDQLTDVINDLIGANPVVKNRVFNQKTMGLGLSKAEIIQALARNSPNYNADIVNRPKIKPAGKKHYFDKNKRTPEGNKMPDSGKQEGRDSNKPTSIEVNS